MNSVAPLLSLRDVTKRYDSGVCALDHVNLTVNRGEFVSLLGPSGCGKSTLLRLVAGLIDAKDGHIHWHDADRGGRSQASRKLGFVFQEPTLMPWRTIAGNVALPQELAGTEPSRIKESVAEALALVKLSSFASAYPRELSGGMKMRVSLARAIATRPDVLLMDEPFAALDEITRHRLNDDLLLLWERLRWTVIFVTHSVYESVYLSSRILVMTPRPGRFFCELAINVPHPRGSGFRTLNPLYGEYCRQASEALHLAMGEPIGPALDESYIQ
nr:ABC transporter ATP-binding protein [uncultured Rhodopila sp.]